MKMIFLSAIAICLSTGAMADIAPNPVQAKGISARSVTEIKMLYEKVTVDLTPDSSYVHCYFKLHNEGNAENIQIGYPYMNTAPYTVRASSYAPISVYQDGRKIVNLNLFAAKSQISTSDYDQWYLWQTHFDQDETMVIEVSYTLPHGFVKNDLYYKFDYLLNTGAGWKGNIDKAEIIVNLKNLDKNLILKASPENFTSTDNQLEWSFYNFEPSEKDNISIKYEQEAGQYSERLKKNPPPLTVLDEKTVISYDIRQPGNINSINFRDLVDVWISGRSKETDLNLPGIDSSHVLLLLYSDKFIPERIIRFLNSKSEYPKKEKIKSLPLKEFIKKYSLEIDGRKINEKKMSYEILSIDLAKISRVQIKKAVLNKPLIIISTNK